MGKAVIIDNDIFYELQKICIKKNINIDKVITDLIKNYIKDIEIIDRNDKLPKYLK
jgi:hypothetical protein